MTERGLPIVDGAPTCPFVAFADDRDERSTSPDHRHRCYAEPEPAPRALAHQEAYCLASAFPVCPTFQDWARREAARTRGPDRTAPTSGGSGADEGSPQRNPPRSWAAPPPWLHGAGTDEIDDDADAEVRPTPTRGGGLVGSFADRIASGDDDAPTGPAAMPEPPGAQPDDAVPSYAPPPHTPPAARATTPERPRATAEEPRPARFAPDRDRGDRGRDAGAPDWEQPRRLEAYPPIRSRRLGELSVSPILIAFVALLLASVVLFALPGLLGFGGPGGGPIATPSSTGPVVASQGPSLEPTAEPAPTQQVYVVQQGDTMSKIANRFGIPLQVLIDANAENIPDPNSLQIGDVVIIPAGLPTEIPAELPGSS